MKELSIKEKAKRYDEALERMKSLAKGEHPECFGEAQKAAEFVFPELKESEDERIRKELLQIAKDSEDSFYMVMTPRKREMLIAWLEKQAEQKQELLTKEKALKNSPFVGQNPSWSEEDELHIRELESLVKQEWAIAECENDKDKIHKMSDLSFFLKTLKPQLKQEWSEEDETMWAEISDLLWEGYKQSGSKLSWDDIRNWVNPKLKSIRPQSHWKPSDEQMKVLNEVLNFAANYESFHWNDYIFGTLNNLIRQLKKLREE